MSVSIGNDLIQKGFKARTEYQHALDRKKKAEVEAESRKRAEEEKEKLRQLALKDAKRKSELHKLLAKENDLVEKQKAAEKKAIQAELAIQKAMEELRKAHAEKEEMMASHSKVSAEKEE